MALTELLALVGVEVLLPRVRLVAAAEHRRGQRDPEAAERCECETEVELCLRVTVRLDKLDTLQRSSV